MANWNGAARSNYVRFEDIEKFKAEFGAMWPEIRISASADGESYCLLAETEYGDWPSWGTAVDSDGYDTDFEFDPVEYICPHLIEGDVLVMMSAGHEKLRYVTGNAAAYNKGGFVCGVSLDDIYDKVAGMLPGDSCTPCRY